MAAQLDLGSRREPTKLEASVDRPDERGLGEIHLGRHALHPRRLGLRLDQAHRGRVSGEGPIGEGIDDGEGCRQRCEAYPPLRLRPAARAGYSLDGRPSRASAQGANLAQS